MLVIVVATTVVPTEDRLDELEAVMEFEEVELVESELVSLEVV
jgi:hypothetical protein